MRIIYIFLLLVLLLTPLAGAQLREATKGSSRIEITLLNQDPDPVEPGQVVEVRFKVENSGAETREDVVVELLEAYPVSVYQGDARQNIGKMQASQTGADASIVSYKLKIDESATEGENELEIKVWAGDTVVGIYDENEFMIDIQTYDAIVSISDVEFSPDPVSPGKETDLKVNVRNSADSAIKNVKLHLELDDVPLIPIGGTNEREIFQILSQEEKKFDFMLKTSPKAEAGVFKIPAKLTYIDQLAQKYNRTFLLGLTISAVPRLETSIRSSTIRSAGETGTITVELANPQEIDVRFLEMTIESDDSYKLLSQSRYIYLGDLESDDTTTEDFEIFATKGSSNVVIPLKLRYKDALNTEYETTATIVLPLFTKADLREFGLASNNYFIIYVSLILLAVVSYLFWRKKKQ